MWGENWGGMVVRDDALFPFISHEQTKFYRIC